MTPIPEPALHAWLDQEDRHTAQVIRAYGTYIQYVSGDDAGRVPSFAYTVGLFGLGHPELLLFGLCPHDSAAVLNELSARVQSGADLAPGDLLTVQDGARRVRVELVPDPGAIVFAANRFYQRPDEASVPVLQLSHADTSGRFPGEAGYATAAWVQPRPGEFSAL